MDNSQAEGQGDFLASLLGDFLDESGQLLERLNESLLQLDDWVRALDDDHQESCDQELMNEMFRSAHSIKGLSGMLGLDDINRLTHKIENVFDAARKDELFITGNVVELMFQAVDGLVNLTDDLKDPDSTPMNCDAIVASIGEVLESSRSRPRSFESGRRRGHLRRLPVGSRRDRRGYSTRGYSTR